MKYTLILTEDGAEVLRQEFNSFEQASTSGETQVHLWERTGLGRPQATVIEEDLLVGAGIPLWEVRRVVAFGYVHPDLPPVRPALGLRIRQALEEGRRAHA